MNKLAAIEHRRSRSREGKFHNRNRNQFQKRYKETENNLYFYHTNFGAKTRKCQGN